MRLKEIELKGFKSFSNKTKVEFKNGITAVVGPNGSGKSNISDAVRWVLGEQSIKTLRGNKMEDVIFAGTDNKKPLGFAEVTITFDNKSGLIPIEYEEVAITRRVFRSGESEYFINKNGCRLKDIRELLMDTGIGKEGYSIISQGRIGEILSNNPADRRGIFEEAAGIIKYKSKKDESVKKLLKTDDNLMRINDLMSELEQQESTLKRQADKAIKYKENYEILKKLEINVLVDSIRDLKANYDKIRDEEDKLSKNLEDIESGFLKLEEETKTLKESLKEEDSIFKSKSENVLLKTKELEDIRNERKILEEKIKFNEEDLKRIKSEEELIRENIKSLNLNMLENKTQIEEKKETLEEIKLKLTKENNAALELLERISKIEDYIEKSKDETVSLYNRISDKKSELNSINSLSENMVQRLDQLNKYIENEKLRLDMEIASMSKLDLDLVDNNQKIGMENQTLIKLEEQKERNQKELFQLENDLNKTNLSIERNMSSYNVYRKMEESYEGYYKGVKNILNISKRDQKIRKAILGVVAEIISVEEKYELAITTALGSSAQFIVTRDQEAAKLVIDKLYETKGGRVTCLPLDTIKAKSMVINQADKEEFNVIGLGSELLKFDEKYKNIIENLLGRTLIVEDMDSGIKLSNKYKNTMRIVTLKGNVINPGGSMTGGSQNQSGTSLLSRKNQLDKIIKEIEEEKKLREHITEEKNQKLLKLDSINKQHGEIAIKLKDLELSRITIDSKTKALGDEISRVEKSIGEYRIETEDLELGNKDFIVKKTSLESDINILEEKLYKLKEDIKIKNQELIDLNSRKDIESKKLTDNKIFINNEINVLNNLENFDKELAGRIVDLEAKFLESNNLRASKSKNLEGIRLKIIDLDEEVLNKDSILENLREEEKTLREARSLKERAIETQEFKLKEIGSSREEYRNSLNAKSIDKVKEEMLLKSKEEDLLDKYDLDYDQALSYIDQDLDLEESKSEIKRLRDIIGRLGSVNLNSIEEYGLLSERLNFMKEQRQDLLNAKLDLEKVISKIDKTMKDKFREEFHKINQNFEEIFKILFNGGQASLVMENEDDILNSGIEIKAMPPGKKLQNLSSLSGGERSLIAVSLLFAILKIKPSPFCILDEIDAALDEANIGRYTNYLKDISDKTQFIIITHRKRTMEIADVLYGVTMEEEGVSKLISVELKDFKDEAS